MTLSAGTRLGPYEVHEPIGAGGMREVYRARDTRLGRDVAVKVLPTERSDLKPEPLRDEGRPGQDPGLRPRQAHARLWRSLRPPDPAGVVVIFDVLLTPDGEGYAYSYGRFLQDLYLLEGLRF